MTKEQLAALSEAATPGTWSAERGVEDAEGEFYVCHTGTVCDATTVCNPQKEADAALIVALVNAHRSGDLVLIDRDGLRETMHKLLCAAYSEGATNVHDAWAADLGQYEADFGEAACDYAGDTTGAAIAAILGEELA